MHMVELHERVWGTDTYRQRPGLQQILSMPVVAFWFPAQRRDNRFTITLHTSILDIEAYFLNLLIHTSKMPPQRRLHRLYMNGRRISLSRVKVHLGDHKGQASG